MTDESFDIQAIENAFVQAAGVALVKPELYWVGDEEGQVSAFDDTGLRNTIWVHKDTQTRDATIAYTDPTKNVKQYRNDLPVRVIPCYDTVRGKRIDWQIIGADVKLASIRPDSDPSIGTGGNVIAHTHQDTDEGGLLDAGAVWLADTYVGANHGGTNNDFIANPPADGQMFIWNAGALRIEPVSFEAGGILIGEQGTTPSIIKPEGADETIQSFYVDPIYRWRRVQNNYSASANPTVDDDETLNYAKGSRWFNATTRVLFFCENAAEGAAVWTVDTLGLGKSAVASGAPTVDDDETLGFQVNSTWFDTDTFTLYICWDATEGAADWGEVGAGSLNNYGALNNPTPSDDETEGYSQGSRWYNTLELSLWMAISVVEDSAVWVEIGSYSQVATQAISNATSTTYVIDATNYFVTVDATSNNVTIELPSAPSVRGRQFIIKRKDSSGNTVTIDPFSTETIDGSATYSLSSQNQSVTLFSDGTEFWVIATA